MKISRAHVLKTFKDYTSAFDMEDVKIRLKADHTYRVAALCDQIARSIGLDEDDVDLAWLLGILHDLGRFVQVQRYGTFEDKLSANHAALSGDLLFKEGHIRDYVTDPSEDVLIEKAVRLHNVLALPEGLSAREKMFADILRDADKVDILKVNCDTPLDEIHDVPMEEIRTAGVSEEVMEDVRHDRLIDLRHAHTIMDVMLAHMGLVYGLVYPESIREVKKQGYLDQLLSMESENPETRKALQEARQYMHAYIEKRLAEEMKKN